MNLDESQVFVHKFFCAQPKKNSKTNARRNSFEKFQKEKKYFWRNPNNFLENFRKKYLERIPVEISEEPRGGTSEATSGWVLKGTPAGISRMNTLRDSNSWWNVFYLESLINFFPRNLCKLSNYLGSSRKTEGLFNLCISKIISPQNSSANFPSIPYEKFLVLLPGIFQ